MIPQNIPWYYWRRERQEERRKKKKNKKEQEEEKAKEERRLWSRRSHIGVNGGRMGSGGWQAASSKRWAVRGEWWAASGGCGNDNR